MTCCTRVMPLFSQNPLPVSYRVEKVGGAIHTEYWIPAEDLSEFNRNIHGVIEVIAEFR